MAKVKVGFLGCGFMGQIAHLPNFLESEQCEVVALCEARPKLAQLVAEKHHIGRVYHSHEELVADPEVEAVAAICRETLNAPISIDLLRAGKHVFVEKPMTTNVEAAREMLSAAEAGGAQLMIAYMKRYDPGVRRAREIVADLLSSGELGALTFARAECFGGDWICNAGRPITTDEPYPDLPGTAPPEWLDAERHSDFMRMNNVYCHNINMLRFILDRDLSVKLADLNAPTWTVIFEAGDITANLEVGGMSAHAWYETTALYFERGRLEVLTPPPLLREIPARVRLYRGGDVKEYWEPICEWSWAFRNEAEHFVSCVGEDRETDSSGGDSVRDLELVEDAFRRFGEQ